MQDALQLLSDTLELEQTLVSEVLVGEKHKSLSMRIDNHLYSKLIGSAEDICDKVRYESLNLPHAGYWINTTTFTSLGL